MNVAGKQASATWSQTRELSPPFRELRRAGGADLGCRSRTGCRARDSAAPAPGAARRARCRCLQGPQDSAGKPARVHRTIRVSLLCFRALRVVPQLRRASQRAMAQHHRAVGSSVRQHGFPSPRIWRIRASLLYHLMSVRVMCPPSTVTTWQPSTAYRGHRQALTALCVNVRSGPSMADTMTVHAPQPPSAHPSFVPVRPSSASHPQGHSTTIMCMRTMCGALAT